MNEKNLELIRSTIRAVPDFPKEGIIFRDITPVIEKPEAFRAAIDELAAAFGDTDFDLIAGLEARGFVFGSPLAYEMKKPLVLIRKKGKLPGETVGVSYGLEYGTAEIEMHRDSIKPGQKVVLVDDLLATGGTLCAAKQMVEKLGGVVVKVVCLIELDGLGGRELLGDCDVTTLISYEEK